jgi:hypothetical protein
MPMFEMLTNLTYPLNKVGCDMFNETGLSIVTMSLCSQSIEFSVGFRVYGNKGCQDESWGNPEFRKALVHGLYTWCKD